MTNNVPSSTTRVVLPDHIVPHRYDLKIIPDLVSFTFEGECRIGLTTKTVEGLENKNEIQLHAKELYFISANLIVEGSSDPPMECEEFRVNTKTTIATLLFPRPIPSNTNSLLLTIQYRGFLNNQMAGFYRSTYLDIDGNPKIMASTQFEALDARRAFPCWDEPSRKAIFGVTLVIPDHMMGLCNMPETSRKTLPASTTGGQYNQRKVELTFGDSPMMSTYLLAFCVGEFDFLQAPTQHGVWIKVYTPPGKAESGRFALDCAVRALDQYDDFFQLPYPLPKLDMVAIPEFAAGAMENWGLVTYREVDLLCDPLKASNQQKQRVCTVVTHELAHQWFGNLVTMAWWDDLWLNEGFASWAENWCANQIFPHYKMWDQFTTGHLSAAMKLDALKSSHPIQVPIAHAEEVEQVFDAISYCKGGSVVRMICAVLGKKAFQRGLADYMEKHKYGNTETYDLWNAWEQASGMPVRELMKSWTEQMGFPMLTITKELWESNQVVLDVHQQWFLSDGSELTPEEINKKWTIPIITGTADGVQANMTLMREQTGTITIPLPSPEGWVKLNANQEVPLRVCNTPEMLRRLEDGIRSKTMRPSDRAAVLADTYAFVKAGRTAPEILVKLLKSYEQEDSYIVWQGLAGVLQGLDIIVTEDPAMRSNFFKLARKIVLRLLSQVGWEPTESDEHLTVLLRSVMISLLGSFCYDDESVATEAKQRFAKFLEDPNDVESLPTDMRTPVFQIVLKIGGKVEYDQLVNYYNTTTDNAERKHVLSSLGHTPDPTLKYKTLEWSTSGAVKVQDFFYAMGSVANSCKEGREMSWKFFQDHFEAIRKMIGKGSSSLMDACIVSCVGSSASLQLADEVEDFFVRHPLPGSASKIAQTLESLRANAKFWEQLQTSPLCEDSFWETLVD